MIDPGNIMKTLKRNSNSTKSDSKIKTLFIHAGGAKTGSSALQNFFELNKNELKNYNLDYENSQKLQFEQEHIFGNGMYLFDKLNDGNLNNQDLDNVLASYFKQSSKAICSNEYFQSLNEAAWQKLIDSCKRLEITLEIIFYIRDVAPFFVSVYDQVIKRHGEYLPITTWAENWPWEHLDTLKILIKFKDTIKIKVVSYDANKSNLIGSFLDLIELDSNYIVREEDKLRIVNRSLTEIERNILLSVNKEFSDKYCGEITDLLIYNNPNAQYSQQYDEHLLTYLTTRFQKEVDWVNDMFFEGASIVAILNPNKLSTKKINLNTGKTSEGIVVDWAIQKLKTQKQDVERFLLSALKKAIENLIEASNNSTNSSNSYTGIPSDFNGLMYVLLNPDLLIAQVDPYKHYANHGISENRIYKVSSNIEFESEYLACIESLKLLREISSVKKEALINELI